MKFEKIRKLLKDVRDKVPFYANMIPEQINEFSDDETRLFFLQIPPADKNIIREDYSRFVSRQVCRELVKRTEYERCIGKEEHVRIEGCHYFFEYTSGSSGTPFVTVKTMSERLVLARALWTARNRLIYVKPEEAFNYNNPSLQLTGEEDLIKSEYKMWMVNVNRLEKLKKYCEMNGTRPNNLRLIENAGSFITVEEQLGYESFFNCIVSNYYGCTETWGIAYSGKNKELTIMENTVFIELLDENDKVITESERVGTVTVTSYIQSTMPFIRYKTDDLAYYVSEGCQCGDYGKVIQLVPNRNMIMGTNLYGNNYFRNVLIKLITQYKINKFKNISILQTGFHTFEVNVSGCSESKAELELGFCMAAKSVFERDDYKFFFRYDQPTIAKCIFSLSPYLLE